MKNMSCWSCALKHIAAALSFAKEVNSGHSIGAELDHRADMLGEIISAEQHLKALESDTLHQIINTLRKKLEESRYRITEEHLQTLRRAWSVVEREMYRQSQSLASSVPGTTTPPKPCGCGKKKQAVDSSSLLIPPSDGAPSVARSAGSRTAVVLPLADNTAAAADAPELRYALRSIAKNVANLGKIYIVSKTLPKWLDPEKITHVKCSDRSGWKDFNIIVKVLAAIDAGVSGQFIRWSDDQFLLLNTEAADMHPATENNPGLWTPEQWQQKYSSLPKTTWWKRLNNTVELLRKHNKQSYNFDSHHPCLYDAERFKNIMQSLNIMADNAPPSGYCINTLYFNMIDQRPVPVSGLLRVSGSLPNASTRYWNVNDANAWPAAQKYLETIFPEPAPWEVLPAVSVPSQSIESIVSPSIPSISPPQAPQSGISPSVGRSAITCTGDRPEQFAICLKIMAKMSPRPDQWIIVDDGHTPISPALIPEWAEYVRREPQPSDPPMTLALNILAGFARLKYYTVAFIEDDDYYPPGYFGALLAEAGAVEACGARTRRYFQLTKNAWRIFHSAFAITASLLLNSPRAIKTYRQVCADSSDGNGLDVKFWQAFTGTKRLHDNFAASPVGIKDWQSGRGPGFAPSHTSSKSYTPDPQRLKLQEWISNGDYCYYTPNTKLDFVIHAPDYRHSSAGIRVLHVLAELLIKRGHTAVATRHPVNLKPDTIVIYPERITNNPRNAKHIVRYVLGIPGKFGGYKSFPENELLIAYGECLAQYAKGELLTINIIEDFFKYNGEEKDIDICCYVGKGKDTAAPQVKDAVMITRNYPATRPEVAALLKRSKKFYTYDDLTMLLHEATYAGCEVKVIANNQLIDPPNLFSNYDKLDAQLDRFLFRCHQLLVTR